MLSSLPALIDEFLPSNAGCAVAKVAVDRAIRIRCKSNFCLFLRFSNWQVALSPQQLVLPLGPVRDGRIVAVRAVGGWEQGPPLSSPSIKGQGEWIPLCLHPSNIPPSSVVVASPPQTGIQLIKICRSNQSLVRHSIRLFFYPMITILATASALASPNVFSICLGRVVCVVGHYRLDALPRWVDWWQGAPPLIHLDSSLSLIW